MTLRIFWRCCACAWVVMVAVAARGADAPPGRRVMKYVTTYVDSQAWMVMAPTEGGTSVKLMIPPEVRSKTHYLNPGDLVSVSTKVGSMGIETITDIAAYDGPKGMVSPRAAILEGVGEEKVGATVFTAVKLNRFGVKKSALVPNRPGLGGKPAPDAALLEKINAIKPGEVVEVEVAPGTIKGTMMLLDIDEYREAQVGEFVKLTTVSEAGKMLPGVILNLNDEPKTFILPVAAAGAANPAAANVNAFVRKLKAGTFIEFTARPVKGQQMIRDARLDVHWRPSGADDEELVATFCLLRFNRTRGGYVYVYAYQGSSRPDDKLIESGLRKAIFSNASASKLQLGPTQREQLRTALDQRTQRVDLTQPERDQLVQLYKTFRDAGNDAERNRVEQQLIGAAIELSNRCRRDVEPRFMLLRSLLSKEQLEEVRVLGAARGTTP